MGWKSRRDDFSRSEKCITRPSTHLTGCSEIDHVLFNSPTMRLNSYSAGTDGLRLGISDLRPVLVGLSHLPHPHLPDTPRESEGACRSNGLPPLLFSLRSSTNSWRPPGASYLTARSRQWRQSNNSITLRRPLSTLPRKERSGKIAIVLKSTGA